MASHQHVSARRNAIFDDRYEIISTVGRGRNSVVYKARLLSANNQSQNDADAIVALKVLTNSSRAHEANHERMRREALALLSSRHPNVIQLHDYVAGEALSYLSMEYADMGDLRQELEQSAYPLDYEVVLHLMHQLLRGLDAIHRGGILHRDIKPENLLLTSKGMLKITDFGIALLPTENGPFEEVNKGIGTLEYLAPEYLNAGISVPTTDLYSVGVTAYQLLTKHLPFEGETLAMQLENKMDGKRIPLRDFVDSIPDGLDNLLGKALSVDPEERYQSAAEFAEAIEAFLSRATRYEASSQTTEEAPATQNEEPHQDLDPAQHGEPAKPDVTPEEHPQDNLLRATQDTAASDKGSSEHLSDVPKHAAPFGHDGDDSKLREMRNRLTAAKQAASEQASQSTRRFPYARAAFFCISLLAICTVVALRAMSPDGGADAAVSNETAVKPVSTVSSAPPPVVVSAQAGIMYDLLAPDSETPLSIARVSGADGDSIVVSIGLAGWVAPNVPSDKWEEGETITVASGGLTFSLWRDKTHQVPNSIENGFYHEKTSGRRGRWILWQ